MALQAVTCVLCVGDSRLRHLQPYLNDNQRNLRFTCHEYPGATMGLLLYQLRLLLLQDRSTYDYILVMGGICDLTVLTKTPTKKLTPAYESVSSMVDNFERIHALFRESVALFTKTPIIYIPLVGVQLVHYSNGDESVRALQPIIDQSIPLINLIIKQVNYLNGLPTPNVAHSIHHCHGRRGKYRTRYCRLYDGCHPDPDTRSIWTREILKSLTNFIYAWN